MILDRIVEQTKLTLEERKRSTGLEQLLEAAAAQRPARDFALALQPNGKPRIIAEAKKASPSKGLICAEFDPVRIARCYEDNGAAAISVLTEEHFFLGHLDYLKDAATISRTQPRLCVFPFCERTLFLIRTRSMKPVRPVQMRFCSLPLYLNNGNLLHCMNSPVNSACMP
jgi:hypothetical protein